MAGSHGGSAESKAALYRVGEWLIDNRGWVSLVTIAFTAFMACERDVPGAVDLNS
jgi:hypothetical protein